MARLGARSANRGQTAHYSQAIAHFSIVDRAPIAWSGGVAQPREDDRPTGVLGYGKKASGSALSWPRGWGFYPASLAPEDAARYRDQIVQRKAREDAGERDGWGPGGYKWRQWDHLKEERRRTEVETQGRASVADLYE